MNKYRIKVWWYDVKLLLFRWFRLISNHIQRPSPNTYLFILCPEYCGSTLITELITQSKNASTNNPFGTREGLSIRACRRLYDYRKISDPNYKVDWATIKEIWKNHWHHSKMYWVEKDPNLLFHLDDIKNHFTPIRWIVSIRNPYVYCESVIRKNRWSALDAARKYTKYLHAIDEHLQQEPQSIFFRYEDLVSNPEKTRNDIIRLFPELSDISIHSNFKAHNQDRKPKPIQNMNTGKIESLRDQDMLDINSVLEDQKELIHFFGYKLLYPN